MLEQTGCYTEKVGERTVAGVRGRGRHVLRAESPGDWGKLANWAHVEDTETQGEGQVG